MSRLSREDVENLIFCMNAPETDGVHYAKFYRELLAHDAALRRELEQATQERDELKYRLQAWNDAYADAARFADDETTKMLKAALAQTQAENARLREALKESSTALNAWIHYHAPDFCEDSQVQKFAQIVQENGGTLAYIAKVQKSIKAALDTREAP